MRVSKAQVQANRDRILREASRLFRERGLDRVTVAEVMAAAGMTQGGFYGHFTSKEDLAAQACEAAAAQVLEGWRSEAEEDGPPALAAIALRYLSAEHRGDPGEGCVMAALGADLARQPGAARDGATRVAQGVVEVLEGLSPGRSAEERRRAAITAYAGWIGAVILARVSTDEAFSREVLAAVSPG